MSEVVLESLDGLTQLDVLEEDEPRGWSSLAPRLGRPVAALRSVPGVGTWAGVVIAASGLALLAVAWGRTAGVTNVALQVPYVVSAGFTGLGLIIVGVTVVNVVAKRADARARSAQLTELRTVLIGLRRTLEPGDE